MGMTKKKQIRESSESDDVSYEIEEILKDRYNKRKRCREFYIKWKNYSSKYNTWEIESNLTNLSIETYEKKLLMKNKTKSENETKKKKRKTSDETLISKINNKENNKQKSKFYENKEDINMKLTTNEKQVIRKKETVEKNSLKMEKFIESLDIADKSIKNNMKVTNELSNQIQKIIKIEFEGKEALYENLVVFCQINGKIEKFPIKDAEIKFPVNLLVFLDNKSA